MIDNARKEVNIVIIPRIANIGLKDIVAISGTSSPRNPTTTVVNNMYPIIGIMLPSINAFFILCFCFFRIIPNSGIALMARYANRITPKGAKTKDELEYEKFEVLM